MQHSHESWARGLGPFPFGYFGRALVSASVPFQSHKRAMELPVKQDQLRSRRSAINLGFLPAPHRFPFQAPLELLFVENIQLELERETMGILVR